VRSVQRYIKRQFAAPKRRARRHVETPPGAQAQADWAEFPEVMIAGEVRPLHAFHLQPSHSRFEAVVWAEREDELSWLTVHNGGLRRLGGVVAAVIRIFTTNKGIRDWPEVLAGDEVLATAILDRLLQKSHVLQRVARPAGAPRWRHSPAFAYTERDAWNARTVCSRLAIDLTRRRWMYYCRPHWQF
jgi:hypothetical protein